MKTTTKIYSIFILAVMFAGCSEDTVEPVTDPLALESDFTLSERASLRDVHKTTSIDLEFQAIDWFPVGEGLGDCEAVTFAQLCPDDPDVWELRNGYLKVLGRKMSSAIRGKFVPGGSTKAQPATLGEIAAPGSGSGSPDDRATKKPRNKPGRAEKITGNIDLKITAIRSPEGQGRAIGRFEINLRKGHETGTFRGIYRGKFEEDFFTARFWSRGTSGDFKGQIFSGTMVEAETVGDGPNTWTISGSLKDRKKRHPRKPTKK